MNGNKETSHPPAQRSASQLSNANVTSTLGSLGLCFVDSLPPNSGSKSGSRPASAAATSASRPASGTRSFSSGT